MNHIQWLRFRPARSSHCIQDRLLRLHETLEIERVADPAPLCGKGTIVAAGGGGAAPWSWLNAAVALGRCSTAGSAQQRPSCSGPIRAGTAVIMEHFARRN